MKHILEKIWNAKEWVFSGIGVAMVSLFFSICFNSGDNVADVQNETNNIEVGGDVSGNIYQNSTFYNLGEDTEKKQMMEKEIVINVDGYKIYPISIDIKDKKKVGDWVYFRYMLNGFYDDETIMYPALFRYQEDVCIAERVSKRACYTFEVVKDCVYYLDSAIYSQDHGVLYISRSDGKNERILNDELYDFQVVDEQYIYYTYRHDTLGAGLKGHALYRMNLDGSDIMIAAYEVLGIDIDTNYFNYIVTDGWVDCGTFKMELGEPADGCEKIVFKDIDDNGWIYYVTNRLIKARRDGSERVELDGADGYYYKIEKIEDDWIYYIKDDIKYKIKTDGSRKEIIIEIEDDMKANGNVNTISQEKIISDPVEIENTNSIIADLHLGESKKYIESILGAPRFEFADMELCNSFYSLDLAVLRFVYDKNDSLIGYFVTVKNSDSKIEIERPASDGKIIVFGENTFEPESYPEAVVDGCVGAGGGAAISTYYWEYSYLYGVGLYKTYVAAILPYGFTEPDSYSMMVVANMESVDSQEIFDYRKALHPNTIGIMDSNYQEIIKPYMFNDENINLWIDCMMKLIEDVQ